MTVPPLRPPMLAVRALLVAACTLASPAAVLAAPDEPVPPSAAVSKAADDVSPDASQFARRLAEQQRPRQVVPFDPAHFDRYVGYYQLGPSAVLDVTRDGGRFFAQLTGQAPVEWYPESGTDFFATVVAAQISFVADPQGNITGLILHQNGMEQPAKRIDEAVANAVQAALARRIASNGPSPGTESFVRRFLASLEAGRPNYDEMTPAMARATRPQQAQAIQTMRGFGALKQVRFAGVDPQGADIYVARSETGKELAVNIQPLDSDGKAVGLNFRPIP